MGCGRSRLPNAWGAHHLLYGADARASNGLGPDPRHPQFRFALIWAKCYCVRTTASGKRGTAWLRVKGRALWNAGYISLCAKAGNPSEFWAYHCLLPGAFCFGTVRCLRMHCGRARRWTPCSWGRGWLARLRRLRLCLPHAVLLARLDGLWGSGSRPRAPRLLSRLGGLQTYPMPRRLLFRRSA